MPEFPAITHVALTVTSLERSVPWYKDLFGSDPILDEDTGRNSQYLWMRSPSDYAATSFTSSSERSAITPFSKATPARTSGTRCGALMARHRVWAASISL